MTTLFPRTALLASTAVALALSSVQPLQAQPADPARLQADMAELQDLIVSQTEELTKAMQIDMEVTYAEEPSIQPVLKAEDGSLYGYEISLVQPRILVGDSFEAAMVDTVVSAFPMEGEEQWLFVTSGPLSLSFSVEGEVVATLTLEDHESRTLLNRADSQLIRSVETAARVSVETADGQTIVSLEDLDIRRAILPNAEVEDRADVLTEVGMANLTITPPEAQEPVAVVGGLDMAFRLQDADLAQILALQEASQRLGEDGAAQDPSAMAGLVVQLIGFSEERGAPFNAEDFEIAATDLDIRYPEQGLAWTGDRVALDFKVRGMNEGAGSVYLGYHHEGLDVSGSDLSKLRVDTGPTDVAFVLGLEGIPNSAVRDALKAGMESMADGDEAAAMMALHTGMTEALSSGSLKLVINEATWNSPTVDAQAGGTLTLNPSVGTGATGDVTLLVSGLEALEALFAAEDVVAELGEAEAAQAAGATGLLKQAGQLALTEEGEQVRVYAFSLTEEGGLMLNGSSIEPLLGLMQR